MVGLFGSHRDHAVCVDKGRRISSALEVAMRTLSLMEIVYVFRSADARPEDRKTQSIVLDTIMYRSSTESDKSPLWQSL